MFCVDLPVSDATTVVLVNKGLCNVCWLMPSACMPAAGGAV